MPSPIRRLFLLAALALLAGCAGVNFTRPDPQLLQVGISTEGDVRRVMGVPERVEEQVRAGERLKILHYGHAEMGGEGVAPGVLPARQMSFTLAGDTLVGQEFVSSFHSDTTDFDAGRLGAIAIGRSTRAEVVATFGRPNGEAVYPLVKDRGQRALIYSYTQTQGSAFRRVTSSKVLIVTLGPDDVVSDLLYTATRDR
jgi:hypothetical protein